MAAGSSPATYELAVKPSNTSVGDGLKTVVYVGATVRETDRLNAYALRGSHLKELFAEARANGLDVLVRTRKASSEAEAVQTEKNLLSFSLAAAVRDGTASAQDL